MLDSIYLVLGMVLVTFLPRYLPIALSSRLQLPPLLVKALQYVPIAVLTVIIVQTSFFQGGNLSLHYSNPFLWGLAAAVACAYIQKNMLLTIVVGMAVFAGAKTFF
ncbi:MAG: AzlD domain-containing protein [Alteromonadaceae bacterium]|nr:AzlD domain-containing protein [Alteromonadaceae bacterium]